MQRGGCVQGWVDLGPVGEQQLHALNAARGTGITEGGTAIDVPGIHLVERKKQVLQDQGGNVLSHPDAHSSGQRHFLVFLRSS